MQKSTKMFLAGILLALAPTIFYEIGVIFYFLFLVDFESVNTWHKEAWSYFAIVMLAMIFVSLFIAGLYQAFFRKRIRDKTDKLG